MPTASATEVFALIGSSKNTTYASCTGWRLSWALLGAGCSNQLQLAKAQFLTGPCPCATGIWLLHRAPTSAQDGLDPVQLVLAVFSCCQLAQRPHYCFCSGHYLQLALVVLFLYQLVHWLMHTRIASLLPPPTTTYTGGVLPLPTGHLLMCTQSNERLLRSTYLIGIVMHVGLEGSSGEAGLMKASAAVA